MANRQIGWSQEANLLYYISGQVDRVSQILASAISGGGVGSFNTRTGAVTLLSADVTGALGYTPTNGNIYTNDGTLTGNRIVNTGQFNLRLSNTETISSGTVTRQPFSVINSTTNSGTGVVTSQGFGVSANLVGTLSNSIVRSNNTIVASRNNASDISSSASNSMSGLSISHNHLPPAPTSILTASVIGYQYTPSNRVGTMNNVWSYYSTAYVSPFGGDQNSSVGNFYGVYISARVGQASGPTGLITNYYGFYLDTPIVGATGTITNRWGIYANDSAMNHHINGNLVIGTTTLSGYKLDVNGTLRASQFYLSALNSTPASAAATGTLGEIRIDANYIYVCTATNTWKRASIATW